MPADSSLSDPEGMPAVRPAPPPPPPVPSGLPLVSASEAEGFRKRWSAIKGGFPDDPEEAVQRAGSLASEITEMLTQRLEVDLDGDKEPSTEDLRMALQRYRTFFERLLSA
jgi:hypothetical protein